MTSVVPAFRLAFLITVVPTFRSALMGGSTDAKADLKVSATNAKADLKVGTTNAQHINAAAMRIIAYSRRSAAAGPTSSGRSSAGPRPPWHPRSADDR